MVFQKMIGNICGLNNVLKKQNKINKNNLFIVVLEFNNSMDLVNTLTIQ